jgi:hypothetical protein
VRNLVTITTILLLAGCAGAPFEVSKTTFHGSIRSAAMERASILYQDGAQSFTVPGGAVWTFGDTFLGSLDDSEKPQYDGARSCTIALLREGAVSFPPGLDYLTGADGAADTPFRFLPGESWDNNRIWPLGGFAHDRRHYLYYSLIEITEGEGPWNFRSAGSGLARADLPLGPYRRLQPGGDWRFPVAASQVMLRGGWVYLFEAGEIDGKKGVILARVRAPRIEEPEAYTFYTGQGRSFAPGRERARFLVEDVYGQVSVAWNEYLEKYVMASSSDMFRPREIMLRVSDALTGPFSPPVATVAIPEAPEGTNLVYCAFLHPELFRDNGRIMVLTWCPMLKNAGFEQGFGNPEMLEIEVVKTSRD